MNETKQAWWRRALEILFEVLVTVFAAGLWVVGASMFAVAYVFDWIRAKVTGKPRDLG